MTFQIYFGFELLALLTALVKCKSLFKSDYKFFIPFLICIVSYEKASLDNVFLINHSNVWATNLITVLEFSFYSLVIWNLLKKEAYKKAILIVILATLAYTAVNLAFIQGIWQLNVSGIILQTVAIIIITGRYFWELMEVPFENSLSIIKQPGFWLNTGVLFFYLGEFLFFVSFSYMAYKHNYNYLVLYRLISDLANAVLYSCLIVCFLCLNPKRKLSISS